MKIITGVLLAIILASFNVARAAEVAVHDGDTFRVDGVKIRLWGVDSPELEQRCKKGESSVPCGQLSKIALQSFIGTKGDIECQVIDVDRYNRNVARCLVGRADLGSMMVAGGYAVAYRQYSKEFYTDQENEARSAKRGLWATEFENPWDWRKRKK